MEVPEHVELDVSGMGMGDSLRLSDLSGVRGRHVPRRPGDGAGDGHRPDARGARGGSRRRRARPRARSFPKALPRAKAPRARASPAQSRASACGCRGAGANGPRRSTCSWSASAIPAGSTRGTATTSAGWSLDELARRQGASWRSKFDGRLAELRLDGHRVALLAPETYMNDSGRSVKRRGAFLQGRALTRSSSCTTRVISTSGGFRRARAAASAATTASARSRSTLGTQDFLRLRVGVGRPGRGDRAVARGLRPVRLRAARRPGRDRVARGRRRRDARRLRPRARAGAVQLTLSLHLAATLAAVLLPRGRIVIAVLATLACAGAAAATAGTRAKPAAFNVRVTSTLLPPPHHANRSEEGRDGLPLAPGHRHQPDDQGVDAGAGAYDAGRDSARRQGHRRVASRARSAPARTGSGGGGTAHCSRPSRRSDRPRRVRRDEEPLHLAIADRVGFAGAGKFRLMYAGGEPDRSASAVCRSSRRRRRTRLVILGFPPATGARRQERRWWTPVSARSSSDR